MYIYKKIQHFYHKYTIQQSWWDQISALDYLVTKILIPVNRTKLFFNQIRSERHYYMFLVGFSYLEDVYQDELRDKYGLKHLNYYFVDKNWKVDALKIRILNLQHLDLHEIMRDLKSIPIRGEYFDNCN